MSNKPPLSFITTLFLIGQDGEPDEPLMRQAWTTKEDIGHKEIAHAIYVRESALKDATIRTQTIIWEY